MNTVSSRNFTVEGWNKNFVAFISDLGIGFNFERVYQDAMDLGITMVSAKTGRTVKFVIVDEQRNRNNDISYWKLEPVKGSPKSVQGWAVYIYNT